MVFCEQSDCLKKFKVVFEMLIKVGNLNRFLMVGANQKPKKKTFFSFLSSLLQIFTESV